MTRKIMCIDFISRYFGHKFKFRRTRFHIGSYWIWAVTSDFDLGLQKFELRSKISRNKIDAHYFSSHFGMPHMHIEGTPFSHIFWFDRNFWSVAILYEIINLSNVTDLAMVLVAFENENSSLCVHSKLVKSSKYRKPTILRANFYPWF